MFSYLNAKEYIEIDSTKSDKLNYKMKPLICQYLK